MHVNMVREELNLHIIIYNYNLYEFLFFYDQ